MAKRKYTVEIAEWASSLRFEDIPERVVEECKSQALSVLGAVLAGSRTENCSKLAAAIASWNDGGATIIPTGARVPLTDALTANSAFSMALDYDDYMIAGHTGHSAVLVPLALSEQLDISGRDFIVAQTIVNEVASRIGASVMLGPLNGQMWSFIHAAGAALAASRLMGLEPAQAVYALGIALSQPNRPTNAGFARGDAKLLTASLPIAAGVNAARLAAAGLTGPEDILESKYGFCAAFSYAPLHKALTNLGRTWLSDTLSYKIYPGCAYLDAPLDCVFEIMKQNTIHPSQVERIDVYGSTATHQLEEFILPFVRHTQTTPVTLNFYTPYNIAAAITDGAIGHAQFTPERIADESLWSLTKKVRVHHDLKYTKILMDNVAGLFDLRRVTSSMNAASVRDLMGKFGLSSPLAFLGKSKDLAELIREGGKAFKMFTEGVIDEAEDSMFAADAQSFKMALGARVEIQTSFGTYEYEQEVPYGAAGWNLEEKRLAAIKKFEKESAEVLTHEAANAAFDTILSLESVDNSALRSLISNCTSKM